MGAGPELIFIIVGLIATTLYFASSCLKDKKWYVGGTACGVFIVAGIILYVSTAYTAMVGWAIALCCICSTTYGVYKELGS